MKNIRSILIWTIGSIGVGLVIFFSILAFVVVRIPRYCMPDGHLSTVPPKPQSHHSYCVKSSRDQVNTPVNIVFSIFNDMGDPVRDFIPLHERLVHVFVVRKDLAVFQHIHPEEFGFGVFALKDLTFSRKGPYRIFYEFLPRTVSRDMRGDHTSVMRWEDVWAGTLSEYTPSSLGEEEQEKKSDGISVRRISSGTLAVNQPLTLSFALSKDGKPLKDLEEYVGALGHVVIVKEGDLDLIHAHPVQIRNAPQRGVIDFHTTLPRAGRYKAFIQFKYAGTVVTTDFVLKVEEPKEGSL